MNKSNFIAERGILKKYRGTEKELVLPPEIKKLGSYSLAKCTSLTAVTFSERLREIGPFALIGCKNLQEIHIPRSLTKIENGAFGSCTALQKITVAPENPVYYAKNDCLMEKSSKKLIAGCKNSVIPEETSSIAPFAFAGCKELLNAEIPQGTAEIGDYAFLRCSELRTVHIPETVVRIGKSAFERCLKLSRVKLPSGIQSIEDNTFSLCASLSEIQIPEGVKKIGYSAFSFCSGLKKIQIPESVSSIGGLAFIHCSALPYLILPKRIGFIETIGEDLPIIGASLEPAVLNEEMRLLSALGYAIAVSRNLVSYPKEYRKIYLYIIQQNKDKLLDCNKVNEEVLSVLRDGESVTLEEVHDILRSIATHRPFEE